MLVSIFSCAEKKDLSTNPLDYITDTTIIPIDRKTETMTRTLQYVGGDLYWWNSDRESISVFDLTTKNLKKTIKMERDGPDGLGSPLGFFLSNPDSIYIPTAAFELSLINSKGERFSDYDYYDYSKLGNVIVSMTRYSYMIQANNSGDFYLSLRDLKNVSPSDLNENALQEYPPILLFNKNKGTFEYLDFRVPVSILKFKNTIDFGLTTTANALLLLDGQSNTLYEVDFNGVDFKEHQLQTDLINNFSNEYYQSPRMSSSLADHMRLAYKYSENFGLTFDPNKNLIYRFGWPGEEFSEDIDAMKFSETPIYFTISVYDGSDFSLIKEFTLPRNTYLAHHYFVDEKGLNLFPMHPDNPEFNEDEMVIHTFDFSDLR